MQANYCSPLLYTSSLSPSLPVYCLLQLRVYVCGLSLHEQSYYEMSNPSLEDRGFTGFKRHRMTLGVPGRTHAVFKKRICAMNRNNKCCHILHSQMDENDRTNYTQTISTIQFLSKCHLLFYKLNKFLGMLASQLRIHLQYQVHCSSYILYIERL